VREVISQLRKDVMMCQVMWGKTSDIKSEEKREERRVNNFHPKMGRLEYYLALNMDTLVLSLGMNEENLTQAQQYKVYREATCRRRCCYSGLEGQQLPWHAHDGRCLRVVCYINEPVISRDGSEDVARALQPVLQLVMGGNILYLITKVGMWPKLRCVCCVIKESVRSGVNKL
jgi:hypothetical protein